MAVGAREDHGVVGRHGRERLVRGKAAHGSRGGRRPLLLVPAASVDPLAGGPALDGSRDPRHHLGVARRPHEVDVEAREADAEEVRVRVLEAGNQRPALQVHDARLRADMRLELGRDADRDDPAAAHRDRLGARPAGVDRVNDGVREHEVCGLGRAGVGRGVEQADEQKQALGVEAAHHGQPPLGIEGV